MKYKQFKRDKIRLYAFLTVCLVFCILLSTFGVFADGNSGVSFSSLYSVSIDDIIIGSDLDINIDGRYFVSSDSQMYTNLVNVIEGGMNVDYAPILPLINSVEDYPNYLLTYANGYIDFIQLPEGSFIAVSNNGYPYLYAPKGYFDEHNRILTFQFNNDGSYHAYYDFDYSYYLNSNVSIDYGEYSVVGMVTNGEVYCYSTDIPIYESGSNSPTDLTNIDTSNQYNPNIDSQNNTETSINNLYFLTADVTYDIGDLNGGNVSCVGFPNEYCKAHPEHFSVQYKYVFSVDVAYNAIGGKQVKNSAVGTQTYQINLEDFNNNGYCVYKSLADIERAATFTYNGTNESIRDVVEYFYDRNVSDDWDSNNVQWYDFTLTTYFWLNDDEGNSSNWYSETYDFLSGLSTVNSNGITNNKYPFSIGSGNDNLSADDVMANGDGTSNDNIPNSHGSGSGSASAVTGDNNIVINNNPTFNNNTSGGSGSGSGSSGGASESAINFYNTFNPFVLIFNKLNNGNSTISDETADAIGSNTFITLMSSVFSFIPVAMWDTLSWYLVASLGILIVAVVLRVILDLL